MNFGSLFAGIGGFDLGFQRAGMDCVWQIEIDAKCQDVLAIHWPDVRRYGDVTECGTHNLDPVDLVCGGFPCQDLSIAGKRKGLAGERSGLWFEFHRILEELAPQWTVIENVPGLLSSNGGRDFAVILRGLAKLGYGVSWRILDAQYFGVPQRRRRVFIVGSLGNGRSAEILFERKGGCWDPPPSREAGAKAAYSLAASVRGTGDGHGQGWNSNYVTAYQCHGSNVGPMGNLRKGDGGLTSGVPFLECSLNAHAGRGQEDTETFVFDWQSGGDVRLNVSRTHSSALQRSQVPAVAVSENQRAEVRLTQYSRQLTSGGGKPGQGYPCVLAFGGDRNGHDAGEVCPPLRHRGDEPHHHNAYDKPSVASSFGVRRLTPTECERLQAFPDGWTAGQADSARYRQLGNAVCVNVSNWIGKRIMKIADESA